MAQHMVSNHNISIKLACIAFGISESCYRYQAKLSSENAEIADWLVKLTENETDWGFGLCYDYLRNVEGFKWNHKRVYRIYCELALNLRIRPRRRLKRHKPEPLKEPIKRNQVWSVDFMHDQLSSGRKIRLFNIIDDYKRAGLAIDVGYSFPAFRMIRSLNQLIEWRGNPSVIRCDNGPEIVWEKGSEYSADTGWESEIDDVTLLTFLATYEIESVPLEFEFWFNHQLDGELDGENNLEFKVDWVF